MFWQVKERGRGGRFLARFLKQTGLAPCLLNPLAGDVEVTGVNLYADKLPAQLQGGYACGAGAHEWVEDRLGVGWQVLNTPLHHANWLLCWVVAANFAGRFNHAVPKILQAANGFRKVSPCQLTVRKVTAVQLVPNEPARRRRKAIVVPTEDNGVPTDGSRKINSLVSRCCVPIRLSVILDRRGVG